MQNSSEEENLVLYQKALLIIKEIQTIVIGKDKVIRKVIMAILAQGHILLEDNPGVGKTTLALAISRTMELDYKRIQFTPEIMPADIVGFSIYNREEKKMEYQPGAALCNLLLVDEINRGSTKTQSALLEVMEEGCITLEGTTRKLPNPNIVIATQNPVGSSGTQLLPESQMDRFTLRLSLGYPEIEEEVEILKKKKNADLLSLVNAVADASDIVQMQNLVESVYVHEDIYYYIAKLADATRKHPMIQMGVSSRGSIALLRMSQANAWLEGRDFVIPSDVASLILDVFHHRIIMSPKAKPNNITSFELLESIIQSVPLPQITKKR